MKTIEDLKEKWLNAQDLAEKIAIRIEMIELNRVLNKADHSIRPIADLLDRIYPKSSNFRLGL